MSNKWCCSRTSSFPRTLFLAPLAMAAILVCSPHAIAGDAPGWMHAVANAPLPAHDEKTDAVLLFSDQVVTVQSENKVKTVVRKVYKILRPGGREYGEIVVLFHSQQKVTSVRGWCIPAQGKDYEVNQKDAAEISPPKIDGGELVSDVKAKFLRIPAADPGNIVGYEYEKEEEPYVLQGGWFFQESVPVREAHYTLQLPPGWEYKATFLNATEVKPTQSGNQWQWAVNDVKGLRSEADMPPWSGVVGQMIVAYYAAGGAGRGKTFADWRQMGIWDAELHRGRMEPSPEIRQQVATITAGAATPLDKMRAIAAFVQKDIRYVAIELGIGGWQPHPAAEVFTHRYGDCKDKATLMAAMLAVIGIESYPVSINTERGSVTPDVPAHLAFDHEIIAIKLPSGVDDPSLYATIQHPRLGKILFFDPTYHLMIPFGQIGGYLQDNYGLLDLPDGGELVKLPRQPSETNSIRRSARLTLTPQGGLAGDVLDVRLGDKAAEQREVLRTVTKEADRIKPIETLLSHSLTSFQITKATVGNLQETSQPFQYQYSVVAPNYAKMVGDLLLVRPRVLGNQASAVLETKEPRQLPLEFDGPSLHTDNFEIVLPPGYQVDELPPPVTEDHSFASYHSKTEVSGNVLHYSRTMEIKELSVPVSKMEELKKFYRVIASDERNNAVLKPAAAK